MTLFKFDYVRGHIHVYNAFGEFLFSADTEKEAREELKEYAKSSS